MGIIFPQRGCKPPHTSSSSIHHYVNLLTTIAYGAGAQHKQRKEQSIKVGAYPGFKVMKLRCGVIQHICQTFINEFMQLTRCIHFLNEITKAGLR